VGCLLIHGFLDRQAPGKAVDRMRFAAFLLALATEGDSVDHSGLEQTRQALQASDERIVELLTLRHQLASQLAQASLGQGAPESLEERVVAVVSRLARSNPGPLDTRRLASIFEIVIQLTEPLSMGLPARNGAAKKG
jgi:chorismate mutase